MSSEDAASASPGFAGQPPLLPKTSVSGQAMAPVVNRISGIGRMALSLLVLLVIGDYCLWKITPGLSWALYAVVIAAAIVLNRAHLTWQRRYGIELLLLLLAVGQTLLRPSLSNALVVVVLLLVLAGDTALQKLHPAWARWVSAALSQFSFPLAWKDFINNLADSGNGKLPGLKNRFARVLQASSLAVILAVVFGLLLGSGNAVLRTQFDALWQHVFDVLSSIEFPEFVRILFWGVLATVVLGLLLPRVRPLAGRLVESELSTFAVKDIRLERLRSLLALAVVNGLFLFTNSIDVLYLWIRQTLPEGVGYSEYVHEGVWSLGFAVVLSAVVIALIFQQDGLVTGSRWLKGLALLWIVQNLLLEGGVLFRVYLYVEAHWMTPKRIYVFLFLALVAVGYALLTRQVLAARFNLKRLIFGNLAAVFCLFFLLQFINVRRLAADYNYHLWRASPERNVMQMDFDVVLGDEMIPLAIRVAESGLDDPAVTDAQRFLVQVGNCPHSLVAEPRDWREWTWRRAQLAEQVREYRAANIP